MSDECKRQNVWKNIQVRIGFQPFDNDDDDDDDDDDDSKNLEN